MRHAWPLDELAPLSCAGVDTFSAPVGGLSLTLVDTLDTLARGRSCAAAMFASLFRCPPLSRSQVRPYITCDEFAVKHCMDKHVIAHVHKSAVIGNGTEFCTQSKWVARNLDFDKDLNIRPPLR
eukprot:gene3051-18_t